MITWILIILVLAAGGAWAWVNFAPIEAQAWHQDPLTAQRSGKANDWMLAPAGMAAGPVDGAAPVWQESPQTVLEAVERVAEVQPRTERLAGDPASGMITYVQRSRIWRFPDFITFRAVEAPEGGTALAVWSRARYGEKDFGVNRKRVSAWLETLQSVIQ